jgi:hypothetical protein
LVGLHLHHTAFGCGVAHFQTEDLFREGATIGGGEVLRSSRELRTKSKHPLFVAADDRLWGYAQQIVAADANGERGLVARVAGTLPTCQIQKA